MGTACTSTGSRGIGDPDAVRRVLRAQSDSLRVALASLRVALSGEAVDSTAVRQAFVASRTAYKHLEGVVEFYAPSVAAALNSRRQEVDDDDAPPPSMLPASGFPVLEALLWPSVTTVNAREAVAIVDDMRATGERVHQVTDAVVPTAAQLLEVARQELARISILSIAGFDTPVTGESLTESASAVDGVRTLLQADPSIWRDAAPQLRAVDSSLALMSAALRAGASRRSSGYRSSFNAPFRLNTRWTHFVRRAACPRSPFSGFGAHPLPRRMTLTHSTR